MMLICFHFLRVNNESIKKLSSVKNREFSKEATLINKNRKQKTENRKQKTENRKQKTENRKQKTENRKQKENIV